MGATNIWRHSPQLASLACSTQSEFYCEESGLGILSCPPVKSLMLPLSHLSLLSHSPSYAKLTFKVSVNFTQTTSKIYEFFNRPFGNHASDISANLSSPDDFSGAVKLVPQYQLVRPPVFDFESVNRSLPQSIPLDYPPLGRD